MKKILIIIIFLLLLVGCTNINETSIDDLVNEVQNSNVNATNQNRPGYKYYLPNDLNMRESQNLNELFFSKNYKYYMYVDLVSYYQKIEFNYEESPTSYFSKDISHNGTSGYLEVNVKDEKYLIEIMYNYAKIELVVDKDYLKEGITNALIILSTIKYNDDIIKNMMGVNELNFGEEHLDIFKTNKGESNFLEYLEDYDIYDGDIPDLDKVN